MKILERGPKKEKEIKKKQARSYAKEIRALERGKERLLEKAKRIDAQISHLKSLEKG